MIIRAIHNRDNPYFMVRRTTAQDSQLPARALGVLLYLMSKPDTWEPTVDDICNRFKDVGREQAYRIINEVLIPLGYARRVQERKDGKISHWVTEIYETPVAENQQVEQPLDAGFQDVGLPDAGYQMLKTSTIDINRIESTEEKLQKEEIRDGGLTRKPRSSRRPTVCDDEFLNELQADPAYEMLNVRQCYNRMVRWCKVRGKHPTQRRFLAWLNNEDAPMWPSKNGGARKPDVGASLPLVEVQTDEAAEFMEDHIAGLIATNDFVQLANERDGITERGGATLPWERRVVEYFQQIMEAL